MRRFRHASVEIPPEGEKRNGVWEKRIGVSAYRRIGVWGERNSAWNTETKDIEARQSFPLCFFRAGQSATLRLMLVVRRVRRRPAPYAVSFFPVRRHADTPIRRYVSPTRRYA